MSGAAWILVGAGALLAGVFLLPRVFISRAQDRLAREKMAREGHSLKLLTRAELVIGRYKRIPGLLSWRDDVLAFQGISGHTVNIPPSRIQKIVTADRIAAGRLLFKLEVLRLMDTDGQELEFVVARNTADQWRTLLGAWAGRERQIAAATPQEVVTPGRKPRSSLLVALLVFAAVPALAAPTTKKPRVRIPQALRANPIPVLSADPALSPGGSGYPAVVLGEPERRWSGEPISLDLKDADIRDVLLTFSKLARMNMVIDPDVRGSVTVRLENVPWDQALEVILKVNGLGYVLEGDIVRVGAPAKL